MLVLDLNRPRVVTRPTPTLSPVDRLGAVVFSGFALALVLLGLLFLGADEPLPVTVLPGPVASPSIADPTSALPDAVRLPVAAPLR